MAAIACLCICAGLAAAQRSPFNGREIPPVDGNGQYRILIGGHFHGASTNRSGYPAGTLLANLDTINALGAHLFLSTGDLYMDARKDSARYARALFRKLSVPFFNAPGNHDIAAAGDPLVMEFDIPLGGDSTAVRFDRVLILDTEHDDGSLLGDQLGRLQQLQDATGLRRLFIVSHRPIWAEDDPRYDGLFKDNTRSLSGTNFRRQVQPILEAIATRAEVFWISGSLGGQAPSSIFFQRHAPGITYIQCALRDEPRDAMLIADVGADGVRWSALSLTGQQLQAPEAYDAGWWRAQRGRGEGIAWRTLPYEARKLFTHRAFWWGAAFGALLVFVLRRRWQRG